MIYFVFLLSTLFFTLSSFHSTLFFLQIESFLLLSSLHVNIERLWSSDFFLFSSFIVIFLVLFPFSSYTNCLLFFYRSEKWKRWWNAKEKWWRDEADAVVAWGSEAVWRNEFSQEPEMTRWFQFRWWLGEFEKRKMEIGECVQARRRWRRDEWKLTGSGRVIRRWTGGGGDKSGGGGST